MPIDKTIDTLFESDLEQLKKDFPAIRRKLMSRMFYRMAYNDFKDPFKTTSSSANRFAA